MGHIKQSPPSPCQTAGLLQCSVSMSGWVIVFCFFFSFHITLQVALDSLLYKWITFRHIIPCDPAVFSGNFKLKTRAVCRGKRSLRASDMLLKLCHWFREKVRRALWATMQRLNRVEGIAEECDLLPFCVYKYPCCLLLTRCCWPVFLHRHIFQALTYTQLFLRDLNVVMHVHHCWKCDWQ